MAKYLAITLFFVLVVLTWVVGAVILSGSTLVNIVLSYVQRGTCWAMVSVKRIWKGL